MRPALRGSTRLSHQQERPARIPPPLVAGTLPGDWGKQGFYVNGGYNATQALAIVCVPASPPGRLHVVRRRELRAP